VEQKEPTREEIQQGLCGEVKHSDVLKLKNDVSFDWTRCGLFSFLCRCVLACFSSLFFFLFDFLARARSAMMPYLIDDVIGIVEQYCDVPRHGLMDAILGSFLEHQSLYLELRQGTVGGNEEWKKTVHRYYHYFTTLLSFSSSLSVLRDLVTSNPMSSYSYHFPFLGSSVLEDDDDDDDAERKQPKRFGLSQRLEFLDADLVASMMRCASLYLWPLDPEYIKTRGRRSREFDFTGGFLITPGSEAPDSAPMASDSRPIYCCFVESPDLDVFLEIFSQIYAQGNDFGGLDFTPFGQDTYGLGRRWLDKHSEVFECFARPALLRCS
jgi:hypothetical protein